jgi:nicotinamide mononucleotide adenylyltransferase
MKSFLQFLKEATGSTAVQQAQRMGLVGDGHGGWYDKKSGEFVAKTEKGQLKFYNKRQKVGNQDPPQTEKEKNLSQPSQEPAPEQDQQTQKPVEMVPPEVEKTKGTLTIAFGRFNPPTTGHEKLLNTVSTSSDDGDYIIVPSRTQDKKKNPLDADTKVSIMRQMFPQHSEKIVNDPANRTIFDVLKKAHMDGYSNVRIVGGADRVAEFEKLTGNYNGKLYAFDNVEIRSAGERDPDSEDDITGMSASKQRKAAAEGDFKTFRKGVPASMNAKQAKELYNMIRAGMNIKEGWSLWEIAPKFDWKNLRENYIQEKIYQVGQLVENLNTGLVGRIIRRGTNYLICVTEDNIMFKSWIKDVSESKKHKEQYQEKKVDSEERVSGKPNTLVGTTGYFKYASKMTPGAIGNNSENLQIGAKPYGIEFINKYRKNK